MGVCREVVLAAAVALRLPVEITILDIDADGETHVTVLRQIRADGRFAAWPHEPKDGRVLPFNHVGQQANLDRAAIARACDETPLSRRSRSEADEAGLIERRNEPVGHDPRADALYKDVTIDRQGRVQIGGERAVV